MKSRTTTVIATLPTSLGLNPIRPTTFDTIKEKYPEVISLLTEEMSVAASFESAVYASANIGASDSKFNVSPESIKKRSIALGLALLAEVLSENAFSKNTKALLIDRLAHIKVVTAQTVAAESDFFEKMQSATLLFGLCGNDLSQPIAIAQAIPKIEDYIFDESGGLKKIKAGAKYYSYFVICPGLIATLGRTSLKHIGVDFILAHELSHFVSADAGIATEHPQALDLHIVQEQWKLLSCLEASYGSEFRNLEVAVTELKEKTDRITNSATLFNSPAFQLYSYLNNILKKLNGALGHSSSGVESHTAEILADYWATRVLSHETSGVSPGFSAAVAANYMSLFCEMKKFPNALFLNGDEGLHPSLDFRIDNFLRSPSLKNAVNLKNPPGGIWCDI